MQCPSCGFENMRGTERCISCRARLILPDRSLPGSLMPPRASWPGRLSCRFRYFWNRFQSLAPVQAVRWTMWLEQPWPFKYVAAAFLSLIPGLGHLLLLRILAAGVSLAIWLVLLGMTIFFWSGSSSAMLLASLLLGWHVQVMMDAAGGRQFQVIKDRLIVAAMLFFTCLVLYGAAYRQIRQRLDIIVLPFDFPSLNANAGTSLLMYKKLDQMVFQKGMMVIYRNSPAMILALPGDRITLEQEFKVNGVVIRREILPQRSPLATEALPGEGTVEQGNIFTKKELVVGPGQMAIAIPVRSYVRGSIDDWNQMRLVSRQSISSYAIGIWLPIRTRYWFRPEDFASFPNLPVRQK